MSRTVPDLTPQHSHTITSAADFLCISVFGSVKLPDEERRITTDSAENRRLPFISKSKFLWGLQCNKLLWHAYNAKELIPEPDGINSGDLPTGPRRGCSRQANVPGRCGDCDGVSIQRNGSTDATGD